MGGAYGLWLMAYGLGAMAYGIYYGIMVTYFKPLAIGLRHPAAGGGHGL